MLGQLSQVCISIRPDAIFRGNHASTSFVRGCRRMFSCQNIYRLSYTGTTHSPNYGAMDPTTLPGAELSH